MTTRERHQKPRAKNGDGSDVQVQPAVGAQAPSSPAEIFSGPRVWLLPTAQGAAIAVPEEADLSRMGAALHAKRPVLLVAGDGMHEASGAGMDLVSREIRDECHESLFRVITRLVIGIVWVGVGVVGLRLSGELKFFDGALLLTGLGYLGYTFARYGSAVVRWHNLGIDTQQSFSRGNPVKSLLLERFAQALKFRLQLKPDERGKAPDAELLDANAYRKLIEEKLVTREELAALGRAVDARFHLHDRSGQLRNIGEVAREVSLDVETAVFYRDLAAAATEIALTPVED
jgi:hypothetical protein